MRLAGKITVFLSIPLVLVLLSLPVHAAPPKTINYQGYLTNSSGTPVSASVSVVFSLYNVSTGGTALWSESQTVTVSSGVYSVILGSATPLTLPFDSQYYLGVKVGADAEMSPRQTITSAAYAFSANEADTAKGNLDTALTGTVSVTAGQTAVTGTGTAFTTELAVGDAIKIGNEVRTVSAIGSATSLTLSAAHAAGASGVTAYKDGNLFQVQDGNASAKVTVDKSGNTSIEGLLYANSGVKVAGGSLVAASLSTRVAEGLSIRGIAGSASDFSLFNNAAATVLDVPTGTVDVSFKGNINTSGSIAVNAATTGNAPINQTHDFGISAYSGLGVTGNFRLMQIGHMFVGSVQLSGTLTGATSGLAAGFTLLSGTPAANFFHQVACPMTINGVESMGTIAIFGNGGLGTTALRIDVVRPGSGVWTTGTVLNYLGTSYLNSTATRCTFTFSDFN